MADSFPCIICGCPLERAFDDYEAQPSDGVMCSTSGNYGSTVYDPMDLSELAFNICDDCLVEKAKEGRVMTTRYHRPVNVDIMHMVGRQRVEHPVYIPWHRGLPYDGSEVNLDETELDELPESIELRFTAKEIRDYLAAEDERRLKRGQQP
jgi:hypothetical protein